MEFLKIFELGMQIFVYFLHRQCKFLIFSGGVYIDGYRPLSYMYVHISGLYLPKICK
jgi:hypothetical protein